MRACAGIDDPVIVREVSAHQAKKSPEHLAVDVFILSYAWTRACDVPNSAADVTNVRVGD